MQTQFVPLHLGGEYGVSFRKKMSRNYVRPSQKLESLCVSSTNDPSVDAKARQCSFERISGSDRCSGSQT
jgi:hypothetical protein